MHRTLAKSLERVHMGDESGGVTARRLRIAGIVTHSAHCSVRLELARMPICSLLNTKSSRGGLSPYRLDRVGSMWVCLQGLAHRGEVI